MNPVLASVLLLGVFVTVSYAGEEEIKTIGDFLKKFAHINIEEVLQNDRLFQAYHKCFLEQGPCTPEAREMRSKLELFVFYLPFFWGEYFELFLIEIEFYDCIIEIFSTHLFYSRGIFFSLTN